MKKRGNFFFFKKSQMTVEGLFKIITFALLLAIAIFFGLFIISLSKGTLFQKVYLSRDLSLSVTTAYASPGNLAYTYTDNKDVLKKFDYDFKNNKVIVVEADTEEGEEAEYTYVGNEIIKKNIESLKKPDGIIFTKTKDEFSIARTGAVKND